MFLRWLSLLASFFDPGKVSLEPVGSGISKYVGLTCPRRLDWHPALDLFILRLLSKTTRARCTRSISGSVWLAEGVGDLKSWPELSRQLSFNLRGHPPPKSTDMTVPLSRWTSCGLAQTSGVLSSRHMDLMLSCGPGNRRIVPKPKSPNTLFCFIPENKKKTTIPCQELVKKEIKKKSPATQGVTGSYSPEYAQHYESTKNTLVCPYHDSCNYGLNSRSWSVGLEKDENRHWSPWLLRPRAVSSLLNQQFLCILIRREELLASPYRGPSNKPHKFENLTVFWIGEEFIACHWCSDLSHWQAGRPRFAGLEKRMFVGTGLDAATATSLLTYMHSRFIFIQFRSCYQQY
jgi:hypothetical protein